MTAMMKKWSTDGSGKGISRPLSNERQWKRSAVCPSKDEIHVDSEGLFEGYASVFGKTDLCRDMVMPGAFSHSLAIKGVPGVKLLFQHDPAQPIGILLDLHEDYKGLFVCGRLNVDVNRARDVLNLMRVGALDGLSIGFRTVKAHRDRRSGVRRIEQVDLWEISVVTFPMLPEARVSVVKKCGVGSFRQCGSGGIDAGFQDEHDGRLERARLTRALWYAAGKIKPERI